MPIVARIFANSYRDSVELMGIAAELEALPGIARAGLVMATPANRDVLAGAGLLTDSAAAAGPNDLVVAVDAEGGGPPESAAARARGPPLRPGSGQGGTGHQDRRPDHRRGDRRPGRRGHRAHLHARHVRRRGGPQGAEARPPRLP